MKTIHNEEKDFYLAQAILYLDELGESDLYYGDDDEYIINYPSKESYHITSGVSKIVIIFDNKDWVIKIPFKGGRKDSFDCNHDNTDASCPYAERSICLCHECEYYYDDTGFEEYQCAINTTLGVEKGWDYCALESKLWEAAEHDALDDIFLCTMLIGEYEGTPIYIQEKADTIGLYGIVQPSDESKKKYLTSFSNKRGFYDETFGAILLDYYGESKLEGFFSFIEKYQISDFHRGNFGFQKKRPVFVDYSGFGG